MLNLEQHIFTAPTASLTFQLKK